MKVELDRKLMFENISFLIREQGRKIGEVEAEAGVSPGYISRTSKDTTAKPGIDFILSVAVSLGVSVDTLLRVDLTAVTPTERYLIGFLQKLKLDTENDKLDWNREAATDLNRIQADINGNIAHPLFSMETYYDTSRFDSGQEVTQPVFNSHSFGCYTSIHGDCFNLRLKNQTFIYFMNIVESDYSPEPDIPVVEVWMSSPDGIRQYLCSDKSSDHLSPLVSLLYASICKYSQHPRIKRNLMTAIDAFMQDDLEDDPPVPISVDNDDLPF